MLYLVGFEKIGVVLGDLYVIDPELPVEEGHERGVRIELRILKYGREQRNRLFRFGSGRTATYDSHQIAIDRPIWRADLLTSVGASAGSLDRAHLHPQFREWEPGERLFDGAFAADPVGSVGVELSNLGGLLERAGFSIDEVGQDDARLLHDAVPEILATLKQLLDRVQAGELATAPADGNFHRTRIGWL